LRLTVAGSSCSIPRPGRACSCYLIESPGATVVADLGSGAFANLIRFQPAQDVDAVVISHMHADHFIDLIPMRYALKYGARTNTRQVLLYLPPGGADLLSRLTGAFDRESHHDFLGEVFDVRTYDPAATLVIGDALLRFAPTSHYIETYALRIEAGGTSVAYSADTAPDDRVADLARDAGAFLCEATLSEAEESDLPRGHVSAREAARMAERAGARRLILSHYPASADPAALEAVARSIYAGPVSVADDGFRLSLPAV
jgi:ribonuclease BN (tRNA processing enzyme)